MTLFALMGMRMETLLDFLHSIDRMKKCEKSAHEIHMYDLQKMYTEDMSTRSQCTICNKTLFCLPR